MEKRKKGKRALARFLQSTINIPMFSKRLEKAIERKGKGKEREKGSSQISLRFLNRP